MHIYKIKMDPKWGGCEISKLGVSQKHLVQKLVILVKFMTIHTYQETFFKVIRIIRFVKSEQSIVPQWNVIMLTSHRLISDIYNKTYMKLVGWVSFVAVIFVLQVIEAVVVSIFQCSFIQIKWPGGHIWFSSGYIYISNGGFD